MATREREVDHPLEVHLTEIRSVPDPRGTNGSSAHAPSSTEPIRILIIENHQVVADALEALLNEQAGMAVMGTLRSVADSRSYTMQMSPDVLVVDFHLTDGVGTEAVRALRENGCRARVIFLSHDEGDLAQLASIEAGASAFLHKSQAPNALIDAVRRVAEGESLIPASTIATLIRKSRDVNAVRSSLTERELDVLRVMAQGVATRDIAAALGISYTTVRTHIRSISTKLGSHSKLEIVVRARELALVI